MWRGSWSIEKPNDLSANRLSFILMDIIPGIVCMSRTGLEFGAERYYIERCGDDSGSGRRERSSLNRFRIGTRGSRA